MISDAGYTRRFTQNGAIEVRQVLEFSRKPGPLIIIAKTPMQADHAIRKHRLYLLLLDETRGLVGKHPKILWGAMTKRLRQETNLSQSDKYGIKRKILGSKIRTARDPRQAELF